MLYANDTFANLQDVFSWHQSYLPASVRIRGNINMDSLQEALEEALYDTGYDFYFEEEQIRHGNFFSNQTEDCLVLKFADHPYDYFSFVFTIRSNGPQSLVSFYRGGHSERMYNLNKKEDLRKSESLFDNLRGCFVQTDELGLEDEKMCYAAFSEAIHKALGF